MLRIAIANMSCGGCARRVGATLRAAGLEAAPEVDLARREIRVAAPDAVPLVAALRAAGWDAAAVAA